MSGTVGFQKYDTLKHRWLSARQQDDQIERKYSDLAARPENIA